MALNGNDDEVNGYNSVIKNGDASDADFVKSTIPPIGVILPWAKTFLSKETGSATSTTANKLVDSAATFVSNGVIVGMVVFNSTDTTFAAVTAVDSETSLSLDTDIFVSGESYTVYATPKLPDGWLECDGSVISDSDSPFDGATLPDLNGSSDTTKKFIRGSKTSGSTTSTATHNHVITITQDINDGIGEVRALTPTSTTSHIPPSFEAVMIMRVK